jgi:hypothetical protein
LNIIDELISGFYGAFDNRASRAVDLSALKSVFIPEAIITFVGEAGVVAMTVDAFIEPRAKMLTDGTLRDFHEWETSESTLNLRDIAVRHSKYQKNGIYLGRPYHGSGQKLIQLVRSKNAWKISAVAWEDESSFKASAS